MDDLIQLLSEGHKLSSVQVQLEPESGVKLRRRERKPRLTASAKATAVKQPNGRPVVTSNRPRVEGFRPSAEMIDIRKDIEQARLRAARAYNRLMLKGNRTPDFRSLERFRELVRKVTLLENKYKEIEVAVHQERQARREAEARTIGEQKECPIRLLKTSLKNILGEKAKDALAEGVIELSEYYSLKAMVSF